MLTVKWARSITADTMKLMELVPLGLVGGLDRRGVRDRGFWIRSRSIRPEGSHRPVRDALR